MSNLNGAIDEYLAAALRGASAADPRLMAAPGIEAAMLDRIEYHGIAGLLADRLGAMLGWPGAVIPKVREVAVAHVMWELRHRQLLNELLAAFAAERLIAILLKGTALAYDLYRAPAARTRGDSDLLIDPSNLALARRVLERTGFTRISGDDFCLQEVWRRTCDGAMEHHIDLHWQLLNAPALNDVLPFAECAAQPMALPRLGPDAVAMDRVRTLIHTCIHRTMHFTAPYFVAGQTHYGGDRLIWLHDIHLLAGALTQAEWTTFSRMAGEKGVAAACLDALVTAQRCLATHIPPGVRQTLGEASPYRRPAAYLRARQFGRAWRDVQAISGLRRKLAYVRARALPPTAFMRNKYPRLARLPVPVLHARRLLDLLSARPGQGRER